MFNVKPKDALNLLSKLNSLLEAVRFEIAQKKESEPINPDSIESFKNVVNSLVVKSLKTDNFPVKYSERKRKTKYDTLEIPVQSAPRNYFSDEQLIAYVNLPESYASFVSSCHGFRL